jgi:hypothetical protein
VISKKKLVVLQDNGYLTQIEPDKKKTTDKVLFEGTSEECENVIHGRKRK